MQGQHPPNGLPRTQEVTGDIHIKNARDVSCAECVKTTARTMDSSVVDEPCHRAELTVYRLKHRQDVVFFSGIRPYRERAGAQCLHRGTHACRRLHIVAVINRNGVPFHRTKSGGCRPTAPTAASAERAPIHFFSR